MSKIVVACGLQKTYLHKEGTCYVGDRIKDYEPRWLSFLKEAKSKKHKIFFTREIHNAEKFKSYIDYIINVNRYNAFYETALGSEVHKIKPREVIIFGLETHTNVLFTAEEFRNRGYDVTLLEPLTTASDDYLHALGVTLLSNSLSVNI
jgi:nicotinamidase-related amidase